MPAISCLQQRARRFAPLLTGMIIGALTSVWGGALGATVITDPRELLVTLSPGDICFDGASIGRLPAPAMRAQVPERRQLFAP